MKTTFRQRNNSNSPKFKRFALVTLTLVVFGSFFYILRSPIFSLAKPVWITNNFISRGTSNFFNFLKSKNNLANENFALRETLSSQEAQILNYRSMESAYENLLSKLGALEDEEVIAGGVLAHPPQTPYDILVLDVGEAHGVNLGDVVALPEGGVLGKISEVLARESKVELFSKSGISTSAILERGEESVTLLGMGGGKFGFTLPREVAVEEGDRILLPGLRGELVGMVSGVELNSTDSEKTIFVRGVANVSNIRFVIVK